MLELKGKIIILLHIYAYEYHSKCLLYNLSLFEDTLL